MKSESHAAAQLAGISLLYEFEGFRLDTHTQCLLTPVDGQRVSLKPKEFDTLLYFVRHPGELIAKETLLGALWPGQVVEENNLNQYITALRKLLGEERGGRRFIMNVRARGYRFVPQVLQLQSGSNTNADKNPVSANKAPTENLIAWQCFQQAVHRQSTDQPLLLCEAVALLEKTIALDPAFAAAYALLALTRIRLFLVDHPRAMEAMHKAMQEARRAVDQMPGVADGHMALGSINAISGRWVEAEFNFLAAREIDAEWVMPTAMHSRQLLTSVGHFQRALALGRRTLHDLKGLTSLAALHVAVCAIANQETEAGEVLEMAIAMGADITVSPLSDSLAILARRRQRFDDAGNYLIAALTPYMQEAGTAKVIRTVFAAIADPAQRPQAQATLQAWTLALDFEKVPHNMRRQILLWHTEVGALDAAFALAFRALERYEHFNIVGTVWGFLWLQEMAPFRRDPRFTGFVQRLKMPEYWLAFGPPDGHLWRDNQLLVL